MPGGIRRYGASDRAISYAVLLSLVLHAALLFSFSMRPSTRSAATPAPIIAHLVAPPAPAVVPPAPQPEPPRPRVEKKPAPPVAMAKPKPSPIPAPKAAPPQPRPAQVAPPPAAPAVAPTPSAPAQPSAPAAVARTEPQPAQNAAEADSLQAYRTELIEVAKKYKRYPRAAMDNNWEGRAVVRMTIGANGMISSISVTSSAGYEILDKQAQDMVQKAKGRVAIPAGLRGRGFTIEVPVIYNLKGDDAG